jgi:hypothetical protein
MTMDEKEWLACMRPKPMLRFLIGTDRPRVIDVEAFPHCKGSDRKLRLFACACYRRIHHLLPNPRARAAVEVAERFADGRAASAELQQAWSGLQAVLEALEGTWRAADGTERTELLPDHEALALAFQVCRDEAPKAAWYATYNASWTAAAIAHPRAALSDPAFRATESAEEQVQANLLRCIFGLLPFRPFPLDPLWPAWNEGMAVKLAEGIYQDRDFSSERMGVLADALEDAGCADEQILTHLREPGLHAQGCWVIDSLTKRG